MIESKEMLLASMVIERDRLLLAVSGLSANEAERQAIGDWSIKDIIAHIAAWDAEATKRLNLLVSGKEAEIAWIDEDEVDAWNEAAVAARRGYSWDQVMAELSEIREGLLTALAAVSDELLAADPGHVPLGTWLPRWTVAHQAHHAAGILAWRAANGF